MDLKGRVSERGLQSPGIAKIGLLPKCPDIGFVLRQVFLLTSLINFCCTANFSKRFVWSVKVVGHPVAPAGSYVNGHNMTIITSLATLIL